MAGLVVVVGLALAFAVTLGFQDGAGAAAATIATRAARPAPALVLAGLGCFLGPLLFGTAVAHTIATLVDVPRDDALLVVGAGVGVAVAWDLVTWRLGLPASGSHALIGGLVGAAVADAGLHAVTWGGFDGVHPVGVAGILVLLAAAPLLGAAAGAAAERVARRAVRRADRVAAGPVRHTERVGTLALGVAMGANDGAKSVGLIALVLLATGHTGSLTAPGWARLASAAAVGLGAALGGWPIARTIGRRVFRMRAVEGLASQASSIGVAAASSAVGAPVSTIQVVASSVVGVGIGRGRSRHVSWPVVRAVLVTWCTTLPGCATLAALTVLAWRGFT